MINDLKEKLDKTKEPYFICIGSMKSMLDSVAPRVGSKLRDLGYKVLGTEDDTIMAKNIHKRLEEEINTIDTNVYQLIYIDVTKDEINPKSTTLIINKPLRPGNAIGKTLPALGEWYIAANVYEENDSDMEFHIKLLSNVYGKEKVEYLVDLCYTQIVEALGDYNEGIA